MPPPRRLTRSATLIGVEVAFAVPAWCGVESRRSTEDTPRGYREEHRSPRQGGLSENSDRAEFTAKPIACGGLLATFGAPARQGDGPGLLERAWGGFSTLGEQAMFLLFKSPPIRLVGGWIYENHPRQPLKSRSRFAVYFFVQQKGEAAGAR
jgi:hypothetical protein